MHWAELWRNNRAACLLLWPFSVPYAAGWEAYRLVYRWGLKRPLAPHKPIVCIGNLQVGGTGKTPVVIAVAKLIEAQGREVVVSSSGYGSPASEGATISSEGELDAQLWGDEAALLRSLLPSVPVIVGRNRVEAAQLCAQSFPDAVLLLDDGFQHLPLEKQVTILLDPEQDNHFCLPAGPYREPRWNRSRADLVIPGRFRVQYSPLSFNQAVSGEASGVPSTASVVCALGNPAKFLESLESAGVDVVVQKLLPDHDPLLAGTLFEGLDPSIPVVVTAKDWGKLRQRLDVGDWNLIIAHREATIVPIAEFASWLSKKLDGDTTQR